MIKPNEFKISPEAVFYSSMTEKEKKCVEEAQSIQAHLHRQIMDQRNKLFHDIARQCLGREVQFDDYNRFSVVINEKYPGRELIAFDGALIGEVKVTQGYNEYGGYTMGWKFEPKTSIHS